MNHSEAWCLETINLGCQTYSQAQAIDIMRHSSAGDKTYSLAFQLIATKLNISCRSTGSSCIFSAVTAADAWLCSHPIGSGVTANSSAWQQIKATYNLLNKYNNGNLDCAPRCPNNTLDVFAAPPSVSKMPANKIGAPAEN
jgi:hypothetical protein